MRQQLQNGRRHVSVVSIQLAKLYEAKTEEDAAPALYEDVPEGGSLWTGDALPTL